MRCIVILVLLYSFFSCNYDKPKTPKQSINVLDSAIINPINDSTIFEFVNFLIRDTNEANFVLRGDKFLDQPQVSYEDFLIDSLEKSEVFSKEDLEFIQTQLKFKDDFSLNPRYLKNKDIISNKLIHANMSNPEKRWTFWEDYRKKYGEKGYCSIALPLFSKDKQTVIIKTYYACGGKCGEGGTFIYKRIKGNWIKIKELSRWIS